MMWLYFQYGTLDSGTIDAIGGVFVVASFVEVMLKILAFRWYFFWYASDVFDQISNRYQHLIP
jgi:hypothetical protein